MSFPPENCVTFGVPEMKIPKQANTTEFKELAVKRVKDGQSISSVIKELGLGRTKRMWSPTNRKERRSRRFTPCENATKIFPTKDGRACLGVYGMILIDMLRHDLGMEGPK